MRDHQTEFENLGVRIFAVTFEPVGRVRQYRTHERLAVPILRDPNRSAYRAFGMERSTIRSLAAPATAIYYLRQAWRGRLARFAHADVTQLGGDVLLSTAGRPCWIYVSREPADRPKVEQILREVRDCADH